ncbi:MAG: ATP-binding protein [Chloroflexota bacterium]|jgi:serine/threonine-protein kinase RsbW|nr:ATP-binding protein [Chloroflexota bacterium]MDH5243122.1 ATP-binding protein [Chloroflexota bacterium]
MLTQPEWRHRIPAELERLAELRSLVREAATAGGATRDAVDDLVQAVDEAAANAIVHGYAGAPGWLELHVAIDGPDIVVTLEDGAPWFDPTVAPEPDMDVPATVRGPGGMGIHLIRLATDALDYRRRADGGNMLTMTRSLDRRPKEDA